jgi:mRNA interferase MazF
MINPKNLIRGSVWLINLDPTIGHEQAKMRPCVIISADTYNQSHSEMVVVLPITTHKHELYWYIPITPPEGGLNKKSYVICDQVRSVSVKRFESKILGLISDFTIDQIEERLKILFYLLPKE